VEQGERSHLSALPPRDLLLRPLTESPGLDTATSIVGRDEIEWIEAWSVVDAMKYVPGAWTETRGRKVKQFFSVRGQTYPYPEFLVDGAYFREFHETDYFLSANTIERIEVLRSSAVLLHGPGGMNGMINIVPRRYTEPEATLTQIYGSDNLSRTQVTYGEGDEKLSYGIGAGFRHTDGNKEMNAEENITNLYANVTYDPTQELTLSMTHMAFFGKRELELAEPPADPRFVPGTGVTQYSTFDPMRTYVFVGKAHYHPSDRASTEITGNYGIRRFFGHQNTAVGWLEEDYEYGARVVQTLRLCDPNTLRFGGTFHRWRSPTGKRFYVGNAGDITTYTAFVVDEHRFDRLTVNTGYRMTWEYIDQFGGFNVEGSPAGGLRNVRIQDDWSEPLGTWTLGGIYELDDQWSLHGNFAWGQIASEPGLFDAQGRRPDTETRFKYDVGLKRAWDGFGEAMVTVFYVDQQNAAIGQTATVLVNGEPRQLFENGDRRSLGVELDLRSKRFDSGTQFFLNTTLMRHRITRMGHWSNDQEVPNFVLGGGVSQMFGDDWEFSLFTKRVGDYENERFLPRGSDPAPLGDFTEVDAKITHYFGDRKQHRAFLMVENIGGQHYSTVNGWPHPGVQYSGGVVLTW
jgi:outer membrane receptor protein involved in Fe transport